MTQRTEQQRKALEVYCDGLAEILNASGYNFNDGKVIRLPVSFTQENVKEYMFKKVMMAMYPDKTSTTELSTTEIQAVYENLNSFTAEHFGVSVTWPSEEELFQQSQGRK